MADYIDIIVKVGDKKASKGIKDGMPVSYIDPDDWGYQPVYSDHMHKVFNIIRVPSSWKTQMIKALRVMLENRQNDGENLPDMQVKRERSAYIDLNELETLSGQAGLVSDLRGPGTVPLLDVRGKSSITTSLLKDSKNYKGYGLKDYNAVSSGSYNVGSGETYTLWSGAYADISDLSGSLTFTGTSSTTETSSSTITEDLNGNVFTSTTDSPPYGDPTDTSRMVSLNFNGHGFVITCDGGGQFLWYDMYVKTTGTYTANYHSITQGNPTNGYLFKLQRNMIDKNSRQGSGIVTGASNGAQQLQCNVIWDQGGSAQGGILTFTTVSAALSQIENNTCYGCYRGIDAVNSVATFDNNACLGNTTDFYDIGSATGTYNASSDTTAANGNWNLGSNNLTSQSTSSCLNSTDDTDPGFCDLLNNGPLADAGTSPTIALSTDIRGRSVSVSRVPIGAAARSYIGPITGSCRNRRT